jgi:TRAP-type uncharacterized transport system fused permease subunit
MFVFAPSLLLKGDAPTVVLAVITASVGVTCLAGGLHEHFFWGRARSWERALLLTAAIVLIKPGWQSDLIGIVLIGLVAASQRWVRTGRAAAARNETA